MNYLCCSPYKAILLFILLTFGLKAQSHLSGAYFFSESLFVCKRPEDFKELSSSNNKFLQTKIFQEKCYLQTDREDYLAGEELRFKAYLTDNTGQLARDHKVLYVEVINRKLELIASSVSKLDGGTGTGTIQIPITATSDTYKIIAYTSSSSSSESDFLFEKNIRVYGREQASQLKDKSKVAIDGKRDHPENSLLKNLDNVITFYPEGGSLVESVPGIIAFKGVGQAEVIKGRIINSAGEKVLDFETEDQGRGAFMLIPEPGKTYKAQGKLSDGTSFDIPLPLPLKKGFNLHLATSSDSTLRVFINTNNETLSENKGKIFQIEGVHDGSVAFTASFTVEKSETFINLPSQTLPAGITEIRLLNALSLPIAQRLVFIPNSERIIFTPKYSLRDSLGLKVLTCNFSLKGKLQRPVKGNFSISVTNASYLSFNASNICDYFNSNLSTSNLTINSHDRNSGRRMELFLLTQDHENISEYRSASIAKVPAESGFQISGVVMKKDGHTPLPGANVSFFSSDLLGNHLLSAVTDSKGWFMFGGLQFFGEKTFKLSSTNFKGEPIGKLILDSLPKIPSIRSKVKFEDELPEPDPKIGRMLTEARSLNDTLQLNEVQVKARKTVKLWDQIAVEFGYPQEEFEIQKGDEKSYTSLEHYLTHKLNYNREIFFPGTNPEGQTLISLPRLFVDGRELLSNFDTEDDIKMAVNLYNAYFGLSLEEVKKVVVKRVIGHPSNSWMEAPPEAKASGVEYLKYIKTGGMTRRDIYIIYITLNEHAKNLSPNVAYITMKGYDPAGSIYFNRADKQNSNTPTVYWNPNLYTNRTGTLSFTLNDISGLSKLNLMIEGVSSTGEVVSYHQLLDLSRIK